MHAGNVVRTLDNTPPEGDADATTESDLTNTDFQAKSPEVSVTFTAPTSGNGFIIVGGGLRDNTNNNRVMMAPEVRLNDVSGGVVYSPRIASNSWTSSSTAGNYQYGCRLLPMTGLIPYQQYFARVMIAVSGGSTGDVFNAQIFFMASAD